MPGKRGKHTVHSCRENTNVAEHQQALTYWHWDTSILNHTHPLAPVTGSPSLLLPSDLLVESYCLRRRVSRSLRAGAMTLGPLSLPKGSLRHTHHPWSSLSSPLLDSRLCTQTSLRHLPLRSHSYLTSQNAQNGCPKWTSSSIFTVQPQESCLTFVYLK